MAIREYKPIAIGPDWISRIKLHHPVPNHVNQWRKGHWRTRMPGFGLLHGIHRKGSNRIDAQLIDVRLGIGRNPLRDAHFSSPRDAGWSVRFDSSNLPKPADMLLSAAELGRPKSVNQISRHGWPHNPAAHAEDVHIVVLNSSVGGEMVLNQARPNTWDFVDTIWMAFHGISIVANARSTTQGVPSTHREDELSASVY